MEFGLKWIHMARYELILRMDGALWLTIIFKPLLTLRRANNTSHVHRARHYQNPFYQQEARAHMGVSFLFFTSLWALYTTDLLSRMMNPGTHRELRNPL